MMRLPNGYGSVHKLSGKRRNPWRVRKTDGWKWMDKDTKEEIIPKSSADIRNAVRVQTYVTIGYYPTQKEALQALANYNKDPYDLHFDTITFGELYERWSDEHFPTVSESNCQGYRAAYKLCDKIKGMNIHDIKLDHLQRIVNESGKHSPTLKKLKIMLGLVYDYAVKHEVVSSEKRNMIGYVDITHAGNPNSLDRKPFSKTEINTLWAEKDANIYTSAVLILIYTGCRIGELLDLKKENVHLDERWFFITASKTESGIREVPIAEKVVPFFEYWMQRKGEYLIGTPEGEHFLYRNFYDSYWKPMMEYLGSTSHKPHDTRHTCVSLLTEAGVDERIIKKIVGHKGQGVTETVYTHLDLSTKLEAINKI